MHQYDLVTWPESQAFIGNSDCFLVDPESVEGDEKDSAATAYDSAYMVPRANGDYVILSWPESQGYQSCKDTLTDNDGHLFVPVEIYGQRR